MKNKYLFYFTPVVCLVLGVSMYFQIQSANLQSNVGNNIGNEAPEINLMKPDSVYLPLSSFLGNYIIVDFWASWCGPCRRENINKVKTYSFYKDSTFDGGKNLVIYSVSLDRNYNNWTTAIASDSLFWDNHVSDLLAWQSVAARHYGVNSIPANFLLNDKGIIIGKNLKGQFLVNKLNELLDVVAE